MTMMRMTLICYMRIRVSMSESVLIICYFVGKADLVGLLLYVEL